MLFSPWSPGNSNLASSKLREEIFCAHRVRSGDYSSKALRQVTLARHLGNSLEKVRVKPKPSREGHMGLLTHARRGQPLPSVHSPIHLTHTHWTLRVCLQVCKGFTIVKEAHSLDLGRFQTPLTLLYVKRKRETCNLAQCDKFGEKKMWCQVVLTAHSPQHSKIC